MVEMHDSVKAVDVMNNLELLMTWKTTGHELSVIDIMNNSGLWLTWTTLDHELKDLVAMNS